MKNHSLPQVWQNAAILGSIWGAFEIIAGSIIHNLALPLAAGTTLSFIGVVIMSLGASIWKQKGLFWRTAAIAAIIKAVSPSAVILTPMIGILLEGILMEIGVQVLGTNLLGYMVGGGLAVISTLFFKLIRLVLIYGLGLIDLYQSLYQMATKQLPIPDSNYWWPVWLLATVYFLLGATAAILGYKLAKRVGTQNPLWSNQPTAGKAQTRNATPPLGEWKGLYWLAFHLLFLILFLAFQDKLHIALSASLAAAYITLCMLSYPSLAPMLRKPKLWIPITIFALAASLLTPSGSTGVVTFYPGLVMISRAAIVIVAFSAIGKELGNIKIRTFFTQNAFSGAYQASLVAFETLPNIISHIQQSRVKSISTLSSTILHSFHANTNGSNGKPKVLIITGDKGAGKSTFAAEAIAEIKAEGGTCAGFVAMGHWDDNNERSHFSLQLISSNTEIPLCNRHNTSWIKSGPFYFNPEAIERGQHEVLSAPKGTILFFDEIGKAEVNGAIWHHALSSTLEQNSSTVVLCVRNSHLDDVVKAFNISSYTQFDARVDCPTDLVKLANHHFYLAQLSKEKEGSH